MEEQEDIRIKALRRIEWDLIPPRSRDPVKQAERILTFAMEYLKAMAPEPKPKRKKAKRKDKNVDNDTQRGDRRDNVQESKEEGSVK